MTTPSRITTQGKDAQVLEGIHKDLQTMSVLPLGATTYSPGSLAAFVQSRIDAANAVNTTRAAWLDALKTYKAINTQAKVVITDLRYLVMAAFGPASPKLADFGFKPPKVAVMTTEQRSAAALKGKARSRRRRSRALRRRRRSPDPAASRASLKLA
jgi:hypothetical protein